MKIVMLNNYIAKNITKMLLLGQTEAIETKILWQIQQWSHPLLDRVMLAITALVNPEVAILVFLITAILLWWGHAYREALMFVFACGGSVMLNLGLKLLFQRPRPELWSPLITEHTYSFPSGHALQGTVLYGAISYLLAIRFPRFANWLYGGAMLLVGAIGLSRLYLGVHWPLDVVAGWIIGFLWLVIFVVSLRLQDLRSALKK